MSKRKIEGPPIAERRKAIGGPGLPPHKRERKFRLNVEWTETRHYTGSGVFTSRAARDEAKARVAREVALRIAGKRYKYFDTYADQYLKGLQRLESSKAVAAEPVFIEEDE